MKEGIPLPCRIAVNADRTYELIIHHPPLSYYLKQAAGVQRGAMGGRLLYINFHYYWFVDYKNYVVFTGPEICGKVTLKQVYEIGLIKQQDPPLRFLPIQKICYDIIGSARSIGIQVF